MAASAPSKKMVLLVAAVPVLVLAVVVAVSLISYWPADFAGNIAWGLLIALVLELTLWQALRRIRSTSPDAQTR